MRGATIAVSGKGGVGKTSLAALIIRRLCQIGSVLAVDADPDSNLSHALGVTFRKSIGEARESVINEPIRNILHREPGITKEEFAKRALFEAVEEFDDFDLVVMGRSEGGGCYCLLNNLIRYLIDFRAGSYNFTVIDCHAGLEHLNRRTTKGVDVLVVVTEPTKNGMLTAKRVIELSRGLSIDVGSIMVVANKVSPATRESLDKTAREHGLEIDFYVPFEEEIAHLTLLGEPMVNLSANSPVLTAVDEVCQKISKSPLQTTGSEAMVPALQ